MRAIRFLNFWSNSLLKSALTVCQSCTNFLCAIPLVSNKAVSIDFPFWFAHSSLLLMRRLERRPHWTLSLCFRTILKNSSSVTDSLSLEKNSATCYTLYNNKLLFLYITFMLYIVTHGQKLLQCYKLHAIPVRRKDTSGFKFKFKSYTVEKFWKNINSVQIDIKIILLLNSLLKFREDFNYTAQKIKGYRKFYIK